MNTSKKKSVGVKTIQALHDPFANLSSKNLVSLPGFRKRLERKGRVISPNLRSDEEDDFRHRFVDRSDESRAWTRQRLG
jgi:hypothetical protein